MLLAREVLLKGKAPPTVDLLLLTSLELLLFKMKILFTFFTKQAASNEEVNCTEASLSLSTPCLSCQSQQIEGSLSDTTKLFDNLICSLLH